MRRFLLCSIMLTGWLINYAGDIRYPVSAIPDNLLKNANAVKRNEEIRIEVVNTGETIEHIKVAVTVLNEKGERDASFSEIYDKLSSVGSIEGRIFDKNGEKIKELKQKEINDQSITAYGTLYGDGRVKWHSFSYNDFPYTVEYEYEIKNSFTLYFPKWIPVDNENLSVQHSKLTVVTPQNYKIRYKAYNYSGSPENITRDNKVFLSWEVNDLAAIERPYASPVWQEMTTSVILAPSDFQVQGYQGNMENWESFGRFQVALNKDRDVLPDDVIARLKQMVSGVDDDHEKVKILYNHLQNTTRYINVTLGIGGWQPFDAAYVYKNGYGDCKALSNYMHSMLKAVGIRSYYTLVHAGFGQDDRFMIEDFPSRQSNHVIVCVPFQKDTMWLECTSQTLPAGYVSGFTANRKAVAITDEGGKVVSTPRYRLNENVQTRVIKGKIDEEGNLEMKINTTYKALQQDELFEMIHELSKEKVKQFLNKKFGLSTYNINDFKYDIKNGSVSQIDELLDVTASSYATVSGKRIFIVPNILSKNQVELDLDTSRKVDYVFDEEFRNDDLEEIELPGGFKLEKSIQDVNIKSKFGTYSVSVKLEGNKIIYHRIREKFSGRFPAKDGADIVKYYADINKADRAKIVLVKDGDVKTEPVKSATQPLKAF